MPATYYRVFAAPTPASGSILMFHGDDLDDVRANLAACRARGSKRIRVRNLKGLFATVPPPARCHCGRDITDADAKLRGTVTCHDCQLFEAQFDAGLF